MAPPSLRGRRSHGEPKPGRARLAPLPRCKRRCGRLVWHFDTGLCGECGHRGQGRRAA